jgi:hypothetical protein
MDAKALVSLMYLGSIIAAPGVCQRATSEHLRVGDE